MTDRKHFHQYKGVKIHPVPWLAVFVLSACSWRALDLPFEIDPGEPPIRIDGGAPSPEIIVITADVSRVILNGARVYWDDSLFHTSVRGCLGASCPPSAIVFADEQHHDVAEPLGLAADAQYLYWADSGRGSVYRCPISGCPAEGPFAIASGLEFPQGIALDGDTIYFADGSAGTILRCPTTGCVDAPELMAANQYQPDAPVVDADYVYWLESTPAGTIRRLAKSSPGAPPDLLVASEMMQAHSLVLAGGYLYFTSMYEGAVRRCAVGGCNNAPELLSEAAPNARALVIDESHIYWSQLCSGCDLGQILRCPIDGCGGAAPDVVASDQPLSGDVQSIAVDASSVYWANLSSPSGAQNGAVMRVAK